MQNYKIVLPEHLNSHGSLFGGYMLMWVDEVAWIAARLDYPECKFVTIGLDNVEFRQSIHEGAIIRFQVDRVRTGTTSVAYRVEAHHRASGTSEGSVAFGTEITLVRVDEQGQKLALDA